MKFKTHWDRWVKVNSAEPDQTVPKALFVIRIPFASSRQFIALNHQTDQFNSLTGALLR